MIEIIPIKNLKQVINTILRQRAEQASSRRSTEYIVMYENKEVAILSYEDWSDKKLGFIYEIYVLPEYREKGIGTKLLLFSENKAIQLGCNRLELNANPFDRSIEKDILISWYEKHGYVMQSNSFERMEKLVVVENW
ncbi:MAG: GNAT family N-acetyltransferase [Desulfobacteraceae bacterium]